MTTRAALSLSTAVALWLAAATGWAQAAPDPAAEAKTLYTRGAGLFRSGQYREALAALERSQALVASPSSALMVARCLEKLGRRIEAADMFRFAEREAQRLLDAGEARYRETHDAAAREGAALQQSLAAVTIRVKGAPERTRVEAGGRTLPLPRDGVLTLFAEPGELAIVVRPADGEPHERTLALVAGASVELALDLAPPAPPPPPPPPETPAWPLAATAVTAGVGLVGVGMFIGFGLSAKSAADELESTCSPNCGPAEQDLADRGETHGLIADVSIGVGGAALLAATVVTVVTWPDVPGALSSQSRARVVATPHGARLLGSF